MKKKLLNAILCGVAILSVSVFSSCKTDLSDLETRVGAWEQWRAEIENQLNAALKTGESITSYSFNETTGVHSFTLSGGRSFQIGGSGAGGTDVTVEIGDGVATITVDGTPYVLPMGSAVNSLIFRPDYDDRIVMLGNDGAKVRFLATPAVSADAVAGATFAFADIHPVESRTRVGGGGLADVSGKGSLTTDGYVEVSIVGLAVEANKKYSASIQMTLNGTTISSDYFTIQVSPDFSFVSEDIDPNIKPKADLGATGPDAGGAYTITMDGLALLSPLSLADLFDGVPAGATFRAANASAQPEGDARNKQSLLASSIAADGAFAWSGRPGTTFGDTGFLVDVVRNYVTVGKLYIKITDPLADVDFRAPFNGIFSQHMESGQMFNPGVNTFDFGKAFTTGDFATTHGNAATFLENFAAYQVSAGDETVLFNDGERIVPTDYGRSLLGPGSRGVNWYNMQTSVLGNNNPEIANGYDGVPGEFMTKIGVKINGNGVFETNEAYMGWGMRVGMGLEFEYAYGLKSMTQGVLGYVFFNRRTYVENLPPIPEI
jgi:hypothetical protein